MKNNKQSHKNFKTVWIQFDQENVDKHQLFFKEHSIRNQEPEHPRGRTLFVLNIPPYVTAEVLKRVFDKHCGIVANVFFTATKGFKTAYIVFEKESALERALELPKNSVIILSDEQNVCLTGVAKWCKDYNDSICDEEKMKKEIEDYMKDYDQRINNKIISEKVMAEGEDNDGWVTVTGQKKRGQFALARKDSVINKMQQEEEQKNKKKRLLNFYTFQIRESKKQNLAELRKKFELDKKRLQDLKSKRTFKPF
ncbi:ribosomal RNA-processing protein 7 homolog A isoform X1 [Augochlora pura]